MIPAASSTVATRIWRDRVEAGSRDVAAETPVAFTYNRLTHAVMMATPSDLEDFAIGFSRSEALIDEFADVEELEIVGSDRGIECRMWIAAARMERLDARRRSLAGPTGCGLCGLESLAEAMRPPARSTAELAVGAGDIRAAMAAIPGLQPLNQATRAVHAAGFWTPSGGVVAVREDVGRHNALDKLGGALMRGGIAGRGGMILLTSRISVELVQKVASIGAGLLVAVSAPTRLALEVADAAGITLVGVARPDGFEVFTHPHRVTDPASS